jgi:hypothetical protein
MEYMRKKSKKIPLKKIYNTDLFNEFLMNEKATGLVLDRLYFNLIVLVNLFLERTKKSIIN